jgi:hypothetical protein
MSLYQVTLYIPDPYERASNVAQTRIVGTLKRARSLAREWLAPLARYETDYSARVTRYADCTIRKAVHFRSAAMPAKEYRAIGGFRENVEPTLHYVPSCSDLGIWPL